MYRHLNQRWKLQPSLRLRSVPPATTQQARHVSSCQGGTALDLRSYIIDACMFQSHRDPSTLTPSQCTVYVQSAVPGMFPVFHEGIRDPRNFILRSSTLDSGSLILIRKSGATLGNLSCYHQGLLHGETKNSFAAIPYP